MLALNVKAARLALTYTQAELAAVCGLSRATISQIESGEGDQALSTLLKIEQALKVPLTYLMLTQEVANSMYLVVGSPRMITSEQRRSIDKLVNSGIERQQRKGIQMACMLMRAAGVPEKAMPLVAIFTRLNGRPEVGHSLARFLP